jgi:ribosomal protein S18 acetylase RimI-like enzyme
MTIIGRATVNNASDIAKVYVDTWRATYAGVLPDRSLLGMSYERQAAEWAWLIRNRADVQPVIVATEAQYGVVGMTSAGLSRPSGRPSGGPYAESRIGEVFTLYVRPEHQDRGIGRLLLSAAFAALAERDCDRVVIWVLRDNPSRYFYERLGGTAVAERRERIGGREVDEVAYGWPDLKNAIGRIGSCSAT